MYRMSYLLSIHDLSEDDIENLSLSSYGVLAKVRDGNIFLLLSDSDLYKELGMLRKVGLVEEGEDSKPILTDKGARVVSFVEYLKELDMSLPEGKWRVK